MSVATSTAIAIGVTAAAGAQTAGMMYGAKKSADASRDAARIQSDAADRAAQRQQAATQQALGYIDTIRANPRPANYGPVGNGAVDKLGSMLNIPQRPSAGPMPMNAPMAPPTNMPQPAGRPMPYSLDAGRNIVPNPAASGSGLVMLRAPNGQQKAVPANQVDHYVNIGAVKVGG